MDAAVETLARLRELCLPWPETRETKTFGHPTFQAGKKSFAVIDEYRGADCLCFKAELLEQQRLTGEARFFAAPYGAQHGWVCMKLAGRMPWRRVEALVERSYRLVASKRMVAALDQQRVSR